MLPTYNRKNRRQEFVQLPKDAYVVRILGAKVKKTKAGNSQLNLAFDIEEGEYKGHYQAMYDRKTDEDKNWPNDGVFRLTVPYPGCPDYIVTNWDSFFADLEDSNGGYAFDGNEKALKGKIIGAKMHIEESEWNGKIYSHTRMRWTCTADAVRQGKAGRLPNDKLIERKPTTSGADVNSYVSGGFTSVPDIDEIPFD